MLFEAIAAVKLANEAIGAVKELCGHIQSVGEMGPHLVKLSDAKEELEKDAKNGDMNAFFELERIRSHEAEIKQIFIYQGRAGLWDDYQKFMANRKELKRKAIEREKAKRLAKQKVIKNALVYGAVGLFTLGIVGGAVALLLFLIGSKGGK